MAWWDKNPNRFLTELKKMETYTNAQLLIVDGDKLPVAFGSGTHIAWMEMITSNSGCRYMVMIICQKDHPNSAPAAWILEPDVGEQHHMFPDGSLCLHDYHLTPDKTYVLNIRNWACHWVECYETGNWLTL